MKRECGPGLLATAEVGAPSAPAVPVSPWWYDYNSDEIVRAADGRRWPAHDVPEFVRSLRDRAHPEVDVDEVDRWVLAQAGRDP